MCFVGLESKNKITTEYNQQPVFALPELAGLTGFQTET